MILSLLYINMMRGNFLNLQNIMFTKSRNVDVCSIFNQNRSNNVKCAAMREAPVVCITKMFSYICNKAGRGLSTLARLTHSLNIIGRLD